MAALLAIYKRNTLKKLKKIKKNEELHQEAEEEIERLKNRLDDAIIANPTYSSIKSNSDGSGFTIPDHLQSYFKHNPFIEQTFFHSDHHPSIRPKPSREIFTQTEVEAANNAKATLHANAIESEVIIHTSSPLVSSIQNEN
jgi:hypothetical protein